MDNILFTLYSIALPINNTWNNPIPYIIHENITYKNDITIALNYIQNSTNVIFIERTNEIDYLEFVNLYICFSYFGKQQGLQYISIGDICDIGAIIRQILKAIGVPNEHSRIDRDNYVHINYTNIINSTRFNFYNDMYVRNKTYDLNSIMHYGEWEYSQNGQKTIQINSNITITNDVCFIGQRYQLSYYDIMTINNLIGLPQIPHINTNINSIYMCGGRNFYTYTWIFTEYVPINNEYYQSKWPLHNQFVYIKYNKNIDKWEIIYKNVAGISTTNDINTTEWLLFNINTDTYEYDNSTYLKNLNSNNIIKIRKSKSINKNKHMIYIILTGIFLIFLIIYCFCK